MAAHRLSKNKQRPFSFIGCNLLRALITPLDFFISILFFNSGGFDLIRSDAEVQLFIHLISKLEEKATESSSKKVEPAARKHRLARRCVGQSNACKCTFLFTS